MNNREVASFDVPVVDGRGGRGIDPLVCQHPSPAAQPEERAGQRGRKVRRESKPSKADAERAKGARDGLSPPRPTPEDRRRRAQTRQPVRPCSPSRSRHRLRMPRGGSARVAAGAAPAQAVATTTGGCRGTIHVQRLLGAGRPRGAGRFRADGARTPDHQDRSGAAGADGGDLDADHAAQGRRAAVPGDDARAATTR